MIGQKPLVVAMVVMVGVKEDSIECLEDKINFYQNKIKLLKKFQKTIDKS